MSRHSRNRHVGEEIGRGRKLAAILGEMIMVAEGVAPCRSVHDLARGRSVGAGTMHMTRRVEPQGQSAQLGRKALADGRLEQPVQRGVNARVTRGGLAGERQGDEQALANIQGLAVQAVKQQFGRAVREVVQREERHAPGQAGAQHVRSRRTRRR